MGLFQSAKSDGLASLPAADLLCYKYLANGLNIYIISTAVKDSQFEDSWDANCIYKSYPKAENQKH